MCNSREEFRSKLREADVVYNSFNGPDLDYAPRLKWFQSGGAGMEWMDDKLRQSPLLITNYARTFAPGISETAIGLLLCLTRGPSKLHFAIFQAPNEARWHSEVGRSRRTRRTHHGNRRHGWHWQRPGSPRLLWLRYEDHRYRCQPIPKPEYVSELHDPGWFSKMVPVADVLVAAAPSTPQTRRMSDP